MTVDRPRGALFWRGAEVREQAFARGPQGNRSR